MEEDAHIMGIDSDLLYKELEMQLACIERNGGRSVVKLGYDERMIVWTEQILPDRMNKIAQSNTVEYVERMIGLLGTDVHRLAAACDRQHELIDAQMRIDELMVIYQEEVLLYAAEIARIRALNQ